MGKLRTWIILITAGLLLLLFMTGCSIMNPFQYKEGRKAYKVKVDEPLAGYNRTNTTPPINQSIAVFPFVDNRKTKTIIYATSVPLSILAAELLAVNGSKYGIFREIGMAPSETYRGRELTFDTQNFNALKDLCRSTGVMWGNINRFEVDITPSAKQQCYNITFFISGNIKLMMGRGSIYYIREFSSTKTYTFRSEGFITYKPEDIYSTGPYFNDFIDRVFKTELDKMAADSKQIMSGSMITPDIVSDKLLYPPENTKMYSFADINTLQGNRALLTLGCGVLGGLGGAYITGQIYKTTPDGGWYAVLLGYPAGMLAGAGLALLLNMGNEEKVEKEALFYATAPVLSPDVVVSMNLINSQF